MEGIANEQRNRKNPGVLSRIKQEPKEMAQSPQNIFKPRSTFHINILRGISMGIFIFEHTLL